MTDAGVDEVGAEIGYEDPAFFRRLFKRKTGLTPSQSRRKFKPLLFRHGGDAGAGAAARRAS